MGDVIYMGLHVESEIHTDIMHQSVVYPRCVCVCMCV